MDANSNLDPALFIIPEDARWDSPPRLIKGRAPIYPASQLLKGKPGKTLIVFTIGIDGKAKDFFVKSSDDAKFSAHAIIAIREWIFQPAIKGGRAIKARVSQEFSYVAR